MFLKIQDFWDLMLRHRVLQNTGTKSADDTACHSARLESLIKFYPQHKKKKKNQNNFRIALKSYINVSFFLFITVVMHNNLDLST